MLWKLESVIVVFLPEQAAPAACLSAREKLVEAKGRERGRAKGESSFPCSWCRWWAPWLRGDSYGTAEHIT